MKMKNLVKFAFAFFILLFFGCKNPAGSNTPPVVSIEEGNQTIIKGQIATFTITATDDENDTLSYRWFVDETEMVNETDPILHLSPSPSVASNYIVKIQVSDGINTVSADATLAVNLPSGNFSTVPNLKGSIFQYSDRIRISWSSLQGADKYEIYRFESKEDSANPVRIGETTELFFEDTNTDSFPPEKDKIYFYKVQSTTKGETRGISSSFVTGLYNSGIDYFEDNNTRDTAKLLSFPTNSDKPENTLSYSGEDGAGSFVADCDWYRFQVPANTKIYITLSLPSGSSLNNGDLLAQFEYNNTPSSMKSVSESADYIFSPSIGGNEGNMEDVYLKVFPGENTKLITEYTITLSDSLN